MDQLPQGAPAPTPPEQPNPQITPPQAASPVPSTSISSVPPVPPAVPTSPPNPSKLKNPKLWIGAGVALLIIVVVSVFFIGKPPLFPGKVPSIPVKEEERRAAGENCSMLTKTKCQNASLAGICEWVEEKGCQAVSAPAPVAIPVTEPEKPPEPAPEEPPPPPPAADIEKTRADALSETKQLIRETEAAAEDAAEQARVANVEEARRAANDAKAAAEAAQAAAQTIENAQTETEIQTTITSLQEAHNRALSNRDAAAALANAARAAEAEAREQEAASQAFKQFCEGLKDAQWNDDRKLCSFNGKTFESLQALQAELRAQEEQEKKRQDCEARPGFEWTGAECREKEDKKDEGKKDEGKKDEVVKIEEKPKCPADKPISFEGQCFEQNQLCSTLGADIANSLKDGKTKPEDVAGALAELNSVTRCNFQAGQFLGGLEEEKARDECKARDQNVWEWDQSAKICKNKQEARISDLENLVRSLQEQLVAAQNANNNAQINALNTQIANLITEMNNLRQAAGQPIVVNVVTPPAPAPALASAAPAPAPAPLPAPAPSSGGGGTEIIDVMTKETKKKKERKATSTTTAESASAAPSVSDSGAAAGIAAVQPATSTGTDGSASASSVTHGAFIQGRTGPGILLYPVLAAAVNGAYFWLTRKKRLK